MSVSDAIASETDIRKSEFEKLIGIENQEKICRTLNKGNRVEIIPVKDGVTVLEVERRAIK